MNSRTGGGEKMYIIVRSDAEINEVLNVCLDREEAGESPLWGMTYEQGVEAAIRWLTDTLPDNPVEQ